MQNKAKLTSSVQNPDFFILLCNYFEDIQDFDITKLNNIFLDTPGGINLTLLIMLTQHISSFSDDSCYVYLVKCNEQDYNKYDGYINIAHFSLNPLNNMQAMNYKERPLNTIQNGKEIPYTRQTFILPLNQFPTLGTGNYRIIIADKINEDNGNFNKIYSTQDFTVIPN